MTAKNILLLAGQRLADERLAALTPPGVAPHPLLPLHFVAAEETALSSTLPLAPELLDGVREILPCFSCLTECGYRFALDYQLQGEKETRFALLDPIGDFPADEASQTDPVVEGAIDLFVIRRPLASAALRLTVHAADAAALQTVPALLSVSLRHSTTSSPGGRSSADGVDLSVPPKSQMVLDPSLSGHVCSPTCLSMLLDFYGHRTDVYDVIAAVRHAPRNMYGVWPANVRAAARWNMLGYLLHFPTWDAARWLLDRGRPIIASIRFEEGELIGVPIPRTSGHLVLLRGYAESIVRVNDPAAPADEAVMREYDLEEFLKIWLERSAVGYAIFPGEQVGV
jgi:hypothetical protein